MSVLVTRRWPGWVALGGVTGAGALGAGPVGGIVALAAMLGIPLFAVMAGAAELAWLWDGAPLSRLAPKVLDEQFAGSPVLVTVPLFIFLGYVLAESQAPKRIVAAAQALLGWMPGGLAIVCLVASAFFTTLTGGSGVTIVAIGGLLLPALLKQGYPEKFSIGLVTTGGSLGLLFPPSLPILVYGLVAGLDFMTMFKAGVLPGLLVMLLLGGYAVWVGHKAKVPLEPANARVMAAALWDVKWELGLPVLLLGSLSLSLATLDESAALGALYTLGVALFVHKDLTRKDLPRILKSSMALSGAVVLILMMANALMNYVIDHQVPGHVLEALARIGLTERWQFLIVLNVFLLVVGMLMDGFSAILVAVPLVLPFAARFGLQPFHLAMMVILNLELAFSAPPLGLNLFIASFRFQQPVASLYRAVMPFVGLLAVSLALVMALPWLSTALVQGDIDLARAQAEKRGEPPREAWVLECVQLDATHPHACSDEDKQRYESVDAGASEEDDALMKELMGN